jgi:hypothetical protein
MEASMDDADAEKQYLWEHFKLNADQRLKSFNFFVIFSIFADGGVFAALDKKTHSAVFLLIGVFICLLSVTFFLIDRRSQNLLRLAVPGLKVFEQRFPPHSRLFTRAEAPAPTVVRYTVAFNILFGAELVFGLGVIAYGLKLIYLR